LFSLALGEGAKGNEGKTDATFAKQIVSKFVAKIPTGKANTRI